MTEKPKIIGIGVSKTGTHSFAKACRILGWDVVHWPTDTQTIRECLIKGIGCVSAIEKHDGAADAQAFAYWHHIVRRFPNAKYVLTVREERAWVDSNIRHHTQDIRHKPQIRFDGFLDQSTFNVMMLRLVSWGCVEFNEEVYLAQKRMHEASVLRRFRDCHNFLVYDICGGEEWAPLCSFLGVSVPRVPFPHEFRTKEKDY